MLKLLATFILFSLCTTVTKSQVLDSLRVDHLLKVELELQLQTFLSKYFDEIEKGPNEVFVLYIYHQDDHYRSYGLHYEGYWRVNRLPPLAYATFQDNLLLIYSGIETYFPSIKRRKELLRLLDGKIDLLNKGDIPPSVDVKSGKLAVCDNGRVIDWEIGWNVPDDPCVIEEPPLKD